jgi:hypothetical protein
MEQPGGGSSPAPRAQGWGEDALGRNRTRRAGAAACGRQPTHTHSCPLSTRARPPAPKWAWAGCTARTPDQQGGTCVTPERRPRPPPRLRGRDARRVRRRASADGARGVRRRSTYLPRCGITRVNTPRGAPGSSCVPQGQARPTPKWFTDGMHVLLAQQRRRQGEMMRMMMIIMTSEGSACRHGQAVAGLSRGVWRARRRAAAPAWCIRSVRRRAARVPGRRGPNGAGAAARAPTHPPRVRRARTLTSSKSAAARQRRRQRGQHRRAGALKTFCERRRASARRGRHSQGPAADARDASARPPACDPRPSSTAAPDAAARR